MKILLNHCRTILWFLRQTARQRLRGRLLQPRYRCELAPGWCLLDLFVLFGLVGLDHGLVFGWINYRKSCLWSPTPSWGIGNFPSFRQEIHSAFYSKTITKEFLITSWWNSLTTFYLKCKCYLWNSFLKFWMDVIQVNLCQKLLFFHQLTHNMTTDCSLNYKFNTWTLQAQTWGEHVEYSLMNMRQLHILFNLAKTWHVIVCWFLCFPLNLPELNLKLFWTSE